MSDALDNLSTAVVCYMHRHTCLLETSSHLHFLRFPKAVSRSRETRLNFVAGKKIRFDSGLMDSYENSSRADPYFVMHMLLARLGQIAHSGLPFPSTTVAFVSW